MVKPIGAAAGLGKMTKSQEYCGDSGQSWFNFFITVIFTREKSNFTLSCTMNNLTVLM